MRPLPLTARGRSTRQRILASAEREFTYKGYHRASIGLITMRARIAVGTFYLYFSSKEDVLCTLVRDLVRQLSQHLSAITGRAPAEMLRLRLRTYIQFRNAHPGLDRIVNAVEWVDGGVFRDYYENLARELQLERQADVRATKGDGGQTALEVLAVDDFLRLWKTISNPSHQLAEPDLDAPLASVLAG